MKRILLLMGLVVSTTAFIAQGVFFVEPPATSQGAYEIGIAADGFDVVPDINDPMNNVTGQLVLAEDAEQNDVNSENDLFDACEDLINSSDLNGKIALVYRGLCEFGFKALSCQDAGAIGVVIINRDNNVFDMGGGDYGGSVTIPVVMITQAAGEIIVNEMTSSDVTGTIGTFNGLYENNVGLLKGDFLLPHYGANRTETASLNDDFYVGTWVRNFGTTEQSVIVEATIIEDGGTSLYDEVSDTILILQGDSAFFALPNYTGGFAEGLYHFTYDIQTALVDSFEFDNSISNLISINEHNLTYARATENSLPYVTSGTRPASASEYYNCISYKESNASLVKADGLYFSAYADEGLTGKLIEATAYTWDNDINDWGAEILDVLGNMDLTIITTGSYEFLENATGQYVYVPFIEGVNLDDDQRYLFCVTTFADDVRLGYDQGIDAGLNSANYNNPSTLIGNDGSWFTGFVGGGVPTVTLKLSDSNVGINEIDNSQKIIAYPNPAVSEITIPFNGSNKVVAVDVYDVTGKLVMSQTVKQTMSKILTMDVSEFETGYYTFKAYFENGKTSTFNVVVNK